MRMIRVLEYEGSREDLLEALLAAKVGDEAWNPDGRVTIRETSAQLADADAFEESSDG